MGINSLFSKYVRMPTGYAVALTAAAFIAACGGSNEASSTRISEPTRAATSVVSPPPDQIEDTFTPVPSVSPIPEPTLEATVEVTVPTYTPIPSPTSTPEPTVVPTPEPTQEPTATPTPETPTPTVIPTPTPVPTPSIMEIRDKMFEDYLNDPVLVEHLQRLPDYQNPTTENLPQLEQLAQRLVDYNHGEYEGLATRATIAAGAWNIQESPKNYGAKEVVESIDWIVEHMRQNDGAQDPSLFAAANDLMNFQLVLNTGEIDLNDGTTINLRESILSDWDMMQTAIAGSAILGWVPMPDLVTVPDWYAQSYPNKVRFVVADQIVFAGPYSTNVSGEFDLSGAPIDLNDSNYNINLPTNSPLYNEIQSVRQQLLDMIAIQENETASDLKALAVGNVDQTTFYYEFTPEQREAVLREVGSLVKYNSQFIGQLDMQSRAFMMNTGNLNVAAMKKGYDVDLMLDFMDETGGSGSFRALGITQTTNNREIFVPLPEDENIILYVTGRTFRRNDFTTGRSQFKPEGWGILQTTEEARDPKGDFVAPYVYSVYGNGTILTIGEPKLGISLPLNYPFVDQQESQRIWTVENNELWLGRSYGVNYIFNPAMLGEGNPWTNVFDNRKEESPQ